MDLEQRPSWSKGDLRRLGKALVIDKAGTPDGCPQYDEVMLWHNELAAEVRARIANTLWVAMPPDELSITARAKTVDTLVQKLQRMTLKLDEVQDLAGVRVDADMFLAEQTNLAQEIAKHFGAAPRAIRDIRANPHSGYRAVHVWLTLPAGRVEVQIRTLLQSEWANVYEAIGEVYGRGIRYGEKHENTDIRELVGQMHGLSATLATCENVVDDMSYQEGMILALSPPETPEVAKVLEQVVPVFEANKKGYMGLMIKQADAVDSLRRIRRRILKEEEGV